MNTRQMEIFYEISKNLNISRTAEKFMVPASSISTTIKRLEDELGIKLLKRTTNSISLTEEGKIYAKSVHNILTILKSCQEEMVKPQMPHTNINILLKTRPKWIAGIIEEFMSTQSNVSFSVQKDYYDTNFDKYDIIVSNTEKKLSNWNNFLLSTESTCIKASKNSPLINKELSIADIIDMPFVLHPKGAFGRSYYEKICKDLGCKENIAIECNDSLLLQGFVEFGLGLTIGCKNSQSDKISSDMVPLNISDAFLTENVFVYYKDSTLENPVKKAFCNLLYSKRFIE